MAGFNGGGASSSLLFNPNNKLPQPFFLSPSSSFLGSSSMMSFEGMKRSERPFYCTYDQDENGEDDYDDYLYQPEKKRRLTGDQVQFLEKSFEVENKLEPERKTQLAKDLGLQPRQVAIWFQNRRARWKTKQLEKDFDSLQSNYNTLKSDYDCLLQEKEKLQAEVVLLTDKLLLKEKRPQKDDSEPRDAYVEPKRVIQEEVNADRLSESEDQAISVFGYKQEDLNSVKSDLIDSDSSPRYVEASHSSLADSSAYAFEADHSDISQDDQDYLSNTLLMPSTHAFFQIGNDIDQLPHHDSCNYYALPGEEDHPHHASLFWPY